MSFFNAEYLFMFLWPLLQWIFDGNPGFVKGIMRVELGFDGGFIFKLWQFFM
jgi:hypothetical protein